MNFEEWEPAYEAILDDFGFDRSEDERARDVLAELARPADEARFGDVEGATVAIAGAGPSLADEIDRVEVADFVVAASSAADVLREHGAPVHTMVTDLDKNPETARTLSHEGVPVVVHAHGDNIPAVRRHVPEFDRASVVATTQAEPRGSVVNYGGFTDGDRAAFLADHFGADELTFPGWDLDDVDLEAEKRRKLRWAERLLLWLERRRGDRFTVLDGRRDDLGLPW